MTEDTDRDGPPAGRPWSRKKRRISVVWIIPILAAVVAIGIAVQRILSEGPTITIVFKAAEGIEAGKTFVKYKDVNIGQVTAVKLCRRLLEGRGDGEDRQERRGPDRRGRQVLGRAAARHPERDLRARHAALRATTSASSPASPREAAARVHRARGAAGGHQRPAGPAVRAAGRRPRARWGSARRCTTAA